MKNRLTVIAAAVLLTLGLMPATAQADWVLTPFAGVSFGGETTKRHLTYGGSLTWMGKGAFGFELDGALAPDLLDGDDDVELSLGDNSVGTMMANVIIGAPLGSPGVRPYVSGGVGLLRIHVDDPLDVFDVDDDSFGMNVGAGLMGFFGEHVGLRGDIRYFRRLQDSAEGDDFDLDLGSFNFWRGTLGLSFRF